MKPMDTSDDPIQAWTTLQQLVNDMGAAVQSKNLHGIHEPSMKIRPAIRTLKGHSSMLGGDKGQKIGAALKQLDTSVTDYRLKLFSFFDDLGWRDENEFRFRIDKPGDQPWTGHSIYFWAFTSNPAHRVFVSFGAGDLLSLACCQRLRVDSCFDPFG